ncbi:hypothetical protein BOTBODRAFT_37629 [Botryobasidium botryosum FD-172 SS1]|uniref:Uncharacterized protein n=1 Tax=Botryobasidium botryosum (strain FD-172 SS1) TaxID=930990 RepID=A0A067MAZ5_BOTB1|nr:hypothetical protein BOTBODRAFT_37629 [Botryobasidium botryosum FD-172 SS1]
MIVHAQYTITHRGRGDANHAVPKERVHSVHNSQRHLHDVRVRLHRARPVHNEDEYI